ncbi:tetraacyldisaccharide 4'-kinase [Sulfuriroseicoccus oceanibius]|uniref:Tetraacyldisaccharide 4'-kinase n=1 Tax=Sulfuriroseicoccus oceanibius TaxID=2707525 RepID=A0A6B3LC93_9BACT|nr:tetraacyldisaccharide 4'-kinase [Sulfuriroseicoccus oceanibius]QQL46005.1 tetraacyldisaccharide 4'-kinase [Sulfuriroseicoccus oceanibius]
MKESLEQLEQYGIEVILGRDKRLKARILRVVLHGLSFIYRGLVWLRLKLYRERVLHEANLGCMVISIGNLSVGGTGKTPVVESFARALKDAGRNVVVLSRGYKSRGGKTKKKRRRVDPEDAIPFADDPPPRIVSDGKNVLLSSLESGDEPFMLAKNLRDIPVVVDKNRIKGGVHAIRDFAADTLILDDGLQYLKLAHRIDIVLVDRNAPFGNEYMLPRGTLREPPCNIARASYVLITKCTGTPGENDELIKRIRKYNPDVEIIECTHRPQYLYNVVTGETEPLELLKDKYVAAMSGIAVPESFENGLRRLGANIGTVARFADHHWFDEREIQDFIDVAIDCDMDMLLTTEKDAVRFPKLERTDIPIYYLRIEIDILSGEETWEECVRRICSPKPAKPVMREFA